MGGARRRLVVLSCAVFAVLLGAVPLVPSASASAHAEQINGTATCEQDGTYTVEWTIAGLAAAETVTPVSVGPASRQLTPDTLQLAADTDGSFVESGIPADSGRAVVILSVLSGVGGSPQAAPSAAPSASSTEGPAAARGGLLRGQVDLDPGCAPSGADAQVVRAVPVEFTDAACTAGIASDPSYFALKRSARGGPTDGAR